MCDDIVWTLWSGGHALGSHGLHQGYARCGHCASVWWCDNEDSWSAPRVCIIVLGLRGSFLFWLPPYKPSAERMTTISWNPSSFCFAIFLFLFPLEFLGLAWELHGEILRGGWMIGRQARPCMNILGMYKGFSVVPQGLIVSLSFSPFGDFRSPFLAIFLWRFWDLSLWDLVGCMHEPFMVLFPLIPFTNLWVSGLNFGVRGVLGGVSLIPLDLAGFGGPNRGYGMPMRYSYYPQCLVRIRGAIWRSRFKFGGVDPRVVVHPESPIVTGLTGASYCSDRCRSQLGFCSGERLGEFPSL
jgi:hypothetical protein